MLDCSPRVESRGWRGAAGRESVGGFAPVVDARLLVAPQDSVDDADRFLGRRRPSSRSSRVMIWRTLGEIAAGVLPRSSAAPGGGTTTRRTTGSYGNASLPSSGPRGGPVRPPPWPPRTPPRAMAFPLGSSRLVQWDVGAGVGQGLSRPGFRRRCGLRSARRSCVPPPSRPRRTSAAVRRCSTRKKPRHIAPQELFQPPEPLADGLGRHDASASRVRDFG